MILCQLSLSWQFLGILQGTSCARALSERYKISSSLFPFNSCCSKHLNKIYTTSSFSAFDAASPKYSSIFLFLKLQHCLHIITGFLTEKKNVATNINYTIGPWQCGMSSRRDLRGSFRTKLSVTTLLKLGKGSYSV